MRQPSHLPALLTVLDQAWQGGFTAKSDLARELAPIVALATERHLITTKVSPDAHSNKHLITPVGLTTLWSLKGIT